MLATAPAEDGGPAAALRCGEVTVLARLLDQLASLGVRAVHVLTRPAWEAELRPSLAAGDLRARLHASSGAAEDLRTVADLARASPGSVVVAYGDLVTHREALAGLLADPRVVTGILTASGRRGGFWVFRTRSTRGRVLSAASPYHDVERPNGAFLGVLKVDPRDRGALVEVAQRLAALAEPSPPAAWQEELERKVGDWRVAVAEAMVRMAEEAALAEDGAGPPPLAQALAASASAPRARGLPGPAGLDPETVVVSDEEEAQVGRRLAIGREDVASLLLVGLVRTGVHVTNSYLRKLFWARPLSPAAAAEASRELAGYDEDRVLLDSAVKANDGFFTTFFVSPYSKYLARWAARRGWTPNGVTTLSMGIGVLAAAAFATGSRPGLVAGAVLLQLAFTADCVDGQLARYTRTFSKLGAWLDSIFDRAKEYVVLAGLAIGSSRGLGDDVWVLASCAMVLQTVRHMFDFSYAATQHHAMATAPILPLEQPGEGAVPREDRPRPLPTSPPEADVAGRTGTPSPAAPAPSPLLAADPVADPPPRHGAAPAAARRLLGELAWLAIAVSRALERWRWTRWLKKILAFPIGERFAVISLTAALASPRTTFLVFLAWGGLAAAYALAGRLLRSFAG